MSRVLLVDTNFSSDPIYRCLVRSGHEVTVVGGNPNDMLAKCVADYVDLDYSNVDGLRQLIKDRGIEYLVPGCNDRSYMACAEVNDGSRFPGIDSLSTAETINNKEKFRKFAAMHGLPTPRVLREDEIGSRWPVIVKPVDAFSGRGVSVVCEVNKDSLPLAMDHARAESRLGACIVEDYVEGQLYSHTAFLQGSSILIDYLVEEHGTANPFAVDTSRVVYDVPDHVVASIRANICALSSNLHLQDGLVHTQFIFDGEKYWLIEVTRRCPGDLYSQLIELSTGFKYIENYVQPFLGGAVRVAHQDCRRWVMRHTMTQPYESTLGSVQFMCSTKIIKWVPISLAGDRLRKAPAGRVAVFFAEAVDESDFLHLLGMTLSRNLYVINEV